MKFLILSAAMAMIVSAAPAECQTDGTDTSPGVFIAAGPDDFRGPCPMLNTLANHGFIPRDGKNITQAPLIKGLKDGLNFNEEFTILFFKQGIKANPEPNATFFTLDMLNQHNVLEHDASLSRKDAFFGNNHVFDQETFDLTKTFWTDSVLTAEMIANSMTSRQLLMRSQNPEFVFTQASQAVTFSEMGTPMVVFGNLTAGTADREKVIFWIENERLPYELGFKKSEVELTQQDIVGGARKIAAATNVVTDAQGNPLPAAPATTASASKMRRDTGWGHGFLI